MTPARTWGLLTRLLELGAIADYVISLVRELLGDKPEREKTYPWALGDVSAKTGHARRLPFDAVWEKRRLIIEVDEDQHRRPVAFWDKPRVITVSGVHRGEQRRLYDERKRAAARREGYTVIEIPWERRPVPANRDRAADLRAVRSMLVDGGVKL
jgi:very-short-patch-repair endonuclease